ncbi:hypothetical protein ACP4OV_019091 [Aristida adscensionis]
MSSAAPASSHGEQFAEVVVVRHGETAWNVSRTIQLWIKGHMDSELNATGKQQAVMVARRLSKEAKPAAVYSSDLKRAAETARTIAAACDVPNLVLDRALRGRHVGDLHGLKWADAVTHPEALKAYSSKERNQEISGGGESLDQLSERCVSYLNEITQKHKEGARDRGLPWRDHRADMQARRSVELGSEWMPNTSVSVLHISGSSRHWILDKFGDVGHLDDDVGFLRNAAAGDGACISSPEASKQGTCGALYHTKLSTLCD